MFPRYFFIVAAFVAFGTTAFGSSNLPSEEDRGLLTGEGELELVCLSGACCHPSNNGARYCRHKCWVLVEAMFLRLENGEYY